MPDPNSQMEIIEEYNIYGEEAIQDMIGQAPGWILRSGIGILFLVVAIGLSLCFLISYPDKIQAPMKITTEYPPVEIMAQEAGRIAQVLIKDQQKITVGTPILYLENNTNPEDLKTLEQFFTQLDSLKSVDAYRNLSFPENLTLGLLQKPVSTLEQQFQELQFLLKKTSTNQQVSALKEEGSRIGDLRKVRQREQKIMEEELTFLEADRRRQKQLLAEKMVSKQVYEAKELMVLQKKRELEVLQRERINYQIREKKLETEQVQLLEGKMTQIEDYQLRIKELRQEIKVAILDWKDRFYLTARLGGICQIPTELVKHAPVTAGQICAYVIPEGEAGKKIAQASVPAWGIGKIKIGDEAVLRLDAYPYKEFGSIYGAVTSMSLLPDASENAVDERYLVTISVGDSLATNYKKNLPYRPNMSGVVQIITKDKSLFYRLFERLISALKN